MQKGTEEEQGTRSQSPTQHPILMSSGRSISRRSPAHSSPYRSAQLHPSLPQSDVRRLEQQIYATMQQHPSRPGGVSIGGVPFFGRHHQTAFERGEVYLASSATRTYPASLGDRSTAAASIQSGLLNGRSTLPPEFLRRYHTGQEEESSLRVAHVSSGSPPDRAAAELGLVGTSAPSHPILLSELVAAPANPTPNRLRSQPPGEDSYSAEYGLRRHLGHAPKPPHLGSQPLMASHSELLDARRPSMYGPPAMAMADLPPRILEESFAHHRAPVAPYLSVSEFNSDVASGNPHHVHREPTTRRSPPTYFPNTEDGDGDDDEDMPPLPPLPNAQPLVQPHQEPEQALQGESSRRRKEVQMQRRPRRQETITTAAVQEIAAEPEIFHFPRPLGIPSDAKYLTEFHCFLRSNLIEVFCATNDDMNAPRRGRKKPVLLGQVGVRCMSCAVAARRSGATEKRNGATYYPTTIASIYNSVMLIQQRHFSECKAITAEARAEYSRLKQILGRSGAAKDYWEDSARKMGLVNTPDGIRHQPPSPSTSMSTISHGSVAPYNMCEQNDNKEPAQPLVQPVDRDLATEYSFFIMQQMSSCTFTESDRLGKRRSHRFGFPGIACIHCAGKNGSGRYFPSSVKTFADASKTINVLHNHILKCSGAPKSIKTRLQKLKDAHHAEKDAMRHGSQKQFFDVIWSRLHNTTSSPSSVATSSPHASPGCDNSSPNSCSFGSFGDSTITSSSTLAVSPDTEPKVSSAATAAHSREVDSSISDVALIMLEMKSPVVWATDEAQHVESI